MLSEVRDKRFPMAGATLQARPMLERFKAVTDWLFRSHDTPIQLQIEVLDVVDQLFDKMFEWSMILVLIARSANLSSVDKQTAKQFSNNNEIVKMK
ncbi:hypothetical protein LguiB_018090 [Lonicera macranthoides]